MRDAENGGGIWVPVSDVRCKIVREEKTLDRALIGNVGW
jgi:hypothetical protein